MMNESEKPQRRLLTTLRDVLFETTAEPHPEVSAPPTRTILAQPNVEAARTALEQSLGDHLGPAIRELMLQVAALEDVLPDPSQRKRAALRVLSLKGIGVPALVLELEHALSALSACLK